MSMRSPTPICSAGDLLAELDGTTLQWWFLLSSHGEFCLRSSGAPRGLAAIHFWGTRFLDCPTQMHRVRLRLANEHETEALRQCLPRAQAEFLRREEHVVIECDDGTYSIQARKVSIKWKDQDDTDPSRFLKSHLGDVDLSAPLWPGGPPLADL